MNNAARLTILERKLKKADVDFGRAWKANKHLKCRRISNRVERLQTKYNDLNS